MARYNEILVGRFNRGLQKLLGIKGGAVAPQLSTEIQPVLPFTLGVEYRYLDGWVRYGLGDVQGALAAANAGWKLRNPKGSNILIVVERIRMDSPDVAATFTLSQGVDPQTDLATVVVANGLDNRVGAQKSTGVVSRANTVTPLSFPLEIFDAAAAVVVGFVDTHNQELPLLPGDALAGQTSGANARCQYSLRWRERFLEESERT